MNQQPDKFFREKLESYQRPVRTPAWDKIETGLASKNSKGLWLKAAASLLLVAAAVYLLWPNAPEGSIQNKSNTITKNNIIIPATEGTKKMRRMNSAKRSDRFERGSKQTDKTEKSPTPETKENPSKALTAKATPDVSTSGREKEIPVKGDTLIDVQPVVPSSYSSDQTPSIATTTSAGDKARTVTLVYTIEEVDENYLDKKSLAKATTAVNKTSRMKKLLNKASDLTRDQHPLGELRQKKDEVLELNFTRKNNVVKKDKPL